MDLRACKCEPVCNYCLYQTSSRGGAYNLTRFGGPEPGLFEALYQNRSSCNVILKESKAAEWLE